MSDPVSPVDSPALDLEAIRARADAAAPGPWTQVTISGDYRSIAIGVTREQIDAWDVAQGMSEPEAMAFSDDEWEAMVGPFDRCTYVGGGCDFVAPEAEFIAHAREDIPALVAEVERLRAELADHHCDCLAGKVAEVRAERDRLAAELAEARAETIKVRREKSDAVYQWSQLRASLERVKVLADEMASGRWHLPGDNFAARVRAALADTAPEETP